MLLVRHCYVVPVISVLYTLFQFSLGLFGFASVHNRAYELVLQYLVHLDSIPSEFCSDSEFGFDPCSRILAYHQYIYILYKLCKCI